MQEVIREFLLETHENLAQLDLDLVALEKAPADAETLARVFRTLHTVKGTAGFLGLPRLQGVAHAAENLLSRLRSGKQVFNAAIASALLAAVDAVRKMLAALEATQGEGEGDYSAVITNLERLTRHSSAVLPAASNVTPRPVSPVTATAPPAAAPAALSRSIVAEPAGQDAAEPRALAVSDSAIRVDVGLLDRLMNLVGELVLARNQLVQCGAAPDNRPLAGAVQRLNRLTTELQANVMKTRMQPIATVWGRFPRVVRDLAAACGKQVRLDMDGQDTELDRTLIEAVRDPLTHLVRNAVDHGIEAPGERAARGKAAEGSLRLHAAHEGGKVLISVADDGGGIDPKRVREKAVQAGLVTREQAERLNDHELVNLVFLPGFSTAEQVTQFSGRGVGMDVVRCDVEKIGGSVAVESRPGRGTTVTLKIPLTLAIIPVLTVSCGGDRYAIPQVSLLELVRLEGGQARRGVEKVHEAPVYRLRGSLLPLVHLDRALQVEPLAPAGVVHIVVLQADDRQFGLVVDAIHDSEEIVVKPLHERLKSLNVFSGATIMGDGRVALILDVTALAQRANVLAAVREGAPVRESRSALERKLDRQTVLLFAADGGQMAIPLSCVERLEEFPRPALERVGAQRVVQYRNDVLPLLNVSRALRGGQRPRKRRASARRAGRGTVQVVVCRNGTQRAGLIVGKILDVVEATLESRSEARRPGVSFTAVVQGRVTEFLDVEAILRSADPAFFAADGEPGPGSVSDASQKRRGSDASQKRR
jgi:two-component system chemotaxis sensor kinase CheA